MITKDLQQVYRAPMVKVVEMGVRSVLCESPLGSSSTEQLVEDDMSEGSKNSIW